jgi:hypothetical protein
VNVRRLPAAALLLLPRFVSGVSLPPLVCSSGGAIGTIDLRVDPSRAGEKPLPLRTINRLEEGETVTYRPILRQGEQRKGEVDVVLVPAAGVKADSNRGKSNRGDSKRADSTESTLLISDPKPAEQAQQWKVPWRAGLVVFVYGPSGLNVRKVKGFLGKDSDLPGQLADYADKTSKTEALLAELSSPNTSPERFQSALQGFSSQFGLNVRISPTTAPTDQQTLALFQAINPAVASYDPLSAQSSASARQTAVLATLVGEMFFGSPVGLAAGGTALLLNLRAIAFPNTEFRSSFSQPMPDSSGGNDGLGLCGKTGSTPAHTQIAYLWATRIPNASPPAIEIGSENSLPEGVKSPLPVSLSEAAWKIIDRARDWSLKPASGGKTPNIKVQKLGETGKLELDLSGVTPGRYILQGNWDWDHFQSSGAIDVRPLSDFKSTHIVPSSQDRLVASTGKVPITLDSGGDTGDFEFLTKVQIEKLHDEFAMPASVPFVLPEGLRRGPQQHVDLQIDTANLDPGQYKLMLSQVDGKAHDVALELLPPPPTLANLPIVINQGVQQADFVLKGLRLDLLKRLEVSKGSVQLAAPAPGQTERKVTVRMANDLGAGTSLALLAYVDGRSQPLTFSDAIRVAGPRPRITEVTLGRPPNQLIQLAGDELPGGAFLSAMITVDHFQSNSAIKLSCIPSNGDGGTAPLGVGSGSLRVQQLTSNQVFLSFDSSGWPDGCVLQALVSNGNEGDSPPYKIGRVVLLPAIDSFDVTGDAADSFHATLTGQNLETIEKLGWSPDQSQPVDTLPLPTADGQKQKLDTPIPPPPDAGAQLFIWLRNETKPRMTTLRAESSWR